MDEITQYKKELYNIENDVLEATGKDLVYLLDKKQQIVGRISELEMMKSFSSMEPDRVPARPIVIDFSD